MKNYIYTGSGSYLIAMDDSDISTIQTIANNYLDINWAWFIQEDGIFTYDNVAYEVKKGNVVMALYAFDEVDKTKRQIVVIDSPILYKNYINNKQQEEKSNNSSCCEGGCEKQS